MELLEASEVTCSSTRCYQWTIDDFLSKVWTRCCLVQSPDFSFCGHDCYITLYINIDENALRLYFCGHDSLPPSLHVRFGMETGYRGTRHSRVAERNDTGSYEVDVWMPYSELIKRKEEILCHGKLTVFCEVRRLDAERSSDSLQEEPPREEEVQEEKDSKDETTVSKCNWKEEVPEESESDDEATVSERKILKKLQNDLKDLLESGEDCDVTIKVQGKEFSAHSIILRMRSPVFKPMFSHEMVEKLSGVVVIDDCDPTTFPDLLNYLYTGSTRHISEENVCQLYVASDKYQVAELREECAAYMKNNISVGNFCDILTLALRHSEKELIDFSTEFFCANASDVAKTSPWQIFLHENTTVGNELFLKSLSRKK